MAIATFVASTTQLKTLNIALYKGGYSYQEIPPSRELFYIFEELTAPLLLSFNPGKGAAFICLCFELRNNLD